ncbi:MAG TPA: hypothetical protein VF669_10625 [Tepidisphaeraceae bacterium]
MSLVIVAALTFLILAARPRTFYLGLIVLITATLIDAVIYLFVGKLTVCYRCRAEFHNHPLNPDHSPFELATAEKYRHLPPNETHLLK